MRLLEPAATATWMRGINKAQDACPLVVALIILQPEHAFKS